MRDFIELIASFVLVCWIALGFVIFVLACAAVGWFFTMLIF